MDLVVISSSQVITWGTPAFGATSNVADEGLGLGAVDVVLAASERAFAAVTPSRGATCLVAWGDVSYGGAVTEAMLDELERL